MIKHGVGVGNMYAPIKKGVMKAVGRPGAGTSASVIMQDTVTGRKYLFKPLGGEPTVDYAHARGVAAGHYADRARAGAIAAGEMGLSTPDVQLVSIGGRKGSLTEWVEPKHGGEVMSLTAYAKQDEARFKALQHTDEFKEALSGIQALDYLVNNVDRVNNLGNYMIELDEHKRFKALIPIDQELSFTHTTDRAIIHGRTSLMPERWTPALAEKVAKLHANPAEFVEKIRPLVGNAAVHGVIERLEQLHADGVRRGFIVPEAMPGSQPTDAAPSRTGPPAATGGHAAPDQAGGPVVAPPVSGKPKASSSSGGSWKHDVEATKDAPGLKGEHMLEHETTEGDTTTKKGKGATWGVGGGNVAQVGGQQVESTTVGDATTTNKKSASLTLKPDGSAVLGSEKSTATYKGTDEHGQPIKTGETKTNKSIGLSEKGLTGTAGAERETAGGHKIGASGSITADSKGNISAEGSLKFESKGGTSFTPSVSGSTTVEASDPTPADGGGFDVTFTVTDSAGASASLGKQFGGGPSIGLSGGAVGAKLNTGTKHFDTEEKAKEFRDNAARYIAAETLLARPPVNTVEGALAIPIGEERGTGDMDGTNWGVSGTVQGATVSYGQSKSTTHQFKVRHLHDKVVQVTGSVVGTKASEAGLSGGIALGRGGSNTHGFEVVWEIDLADKAGRNAFEAYAKAGLPPVGAKLVSMTSTSSEEDHDSVSIPLLGTAKWTGAVWEIIREDASGRHAQFGGKQTHDQDPSWSGKLLGQDTIHSNAQITSKLDTDKEGKQEESYEAQITVSGTTGEETRKELGQIWMGVPHEGTAKASGEWILTGQVSAKVVHELEQVNKDMRDAPTKEDKMRVYSALVKERGIKMVGAQVGLGGDPLAWNVELKGDKNFPGNAGRAALDAKRAELRGKLKDAKAAKGVVGEAQNTLDLLRARRLAVADKTKYTDLPDGLRDQQLKLIDRHISDFEFIRHMGLKAAVKGETPAKPATKPDAAGAGGYTGNAEAAESAELVKLRTQIGEKSDAISAIDFRNNRLISAVMQAKDHFVDVPNTAYIGWVSSHRISMQEHWDRGISLNEMQSPMGPKIDALRQRLLDALFEVDRKAAAQELLKLLTDRLALLEALHTEAQAAAEYLKPITTDAGMKGYPKLWASIKGDPAPWTDEGVGTNDD